MAGCAAVLALAAAAPAAETPSPMVVKDPKDAVAGAPDLTRAQIGLASDRRVRFALTLAAPWQPKDLIARRGAAGLAVRAPVDGDQARRHAARLPRVRDGARRRRDHARHRLQDASRASSWPGPALAIVGRTSDRTMTLRFSQTLVGRPKTIDFIAEATKPGCTRVSCVDTAPEAPKTATFRLRGSS